MSEQEKSAVTFSGAALKARVADIFDLNRGDEDENDSEGEVIDRAALLGGNSSKPGARRLGIGAVEDAEDDSKSSADRLTKLAAAASSAKKREKPSQKRPRSALEAFANDGSDSEEEIGKASTVRKRKSLPSLVDTIVEEHDNEDNSTKKKKKKKSKKSKKSKDTTDEEGSNSKAQIAPETHEKDKEPPAAEENNSEDVEKEAPKKVAYADRFKDDARKAALAEQDAQGMDAPPPQKRQRKKKRSKQKNFKKDTRPQGTWLKTQNKAKDLGPREAPPIQEADRWD